MEWSLIFGGLCGWVWAAGIGATAGYALFASGLHSAVVARRRLREGRPRAAFWWSLYAVLFGAAWQAAALALLGRWVFRGPDESELFLLVCASLPALSMPAGGWVLWRWWRGR